MINLNIVSLVTQLSIRAHEFGKANKRNSICDHGAKNDMTGFDPWNSVDYEKSTEHPVICKGGRKERSQRDWQCQCEN